jgi:hypothetical protein
MKKFLVVVSLVLALIVMGCSNSVPSAPTGLTVSSEALSGGGDKITIAWNAVSDATSYTIYDTKDGTTPSTSNYFKYYTTTNTTYYLTNVSMRTLYHVIVMANNSYGTSEPSGIASTTTP